MKSTKVFFETATKGVSVTALQEILDASFFDCDGCLLDSEFLAMSDLGNKIDEALKDVGHEEGLNNPSFVSEYAGWHANNIIKDILDKREIHFDGDADKRDAFIRGVEAAHKESVVETLARDVVTFDGMEHVVRTMKDAAHGNQCVVTSSEQRRVAPGLEKNGLLDFFKDQDGNTRIFSAPELTPNNKKPDPHIYLYALDHYGASASRASTMEDSVSGVKSAVNAKLGYIVGFVGGEHIPQDQKEDHAKMLLSLGAHKVIADVRDYPAAVLAIHQERLMKNAPTADRTLARNMSP